MEFILASGNSHKAYEFSELFDENILKVSAAPYAIDVVEDGVSYYENALKKAEGYYKEFGRPVMSDDSGINVNALPDELGIHSARFGGEDLTFTERISLLLDKLNVVPDEDRKASFSCILCFYINPDEIYYFEGKIEGIISKTPMGKLGFGYDPVFVPEELIKKNISFAMDPDWKKIHSHRARACKKATQFFVQTDCQN